MKKCHQCGYVNVKPSEKCPICKANYALGDAEAERLNQVKAAAEEEREAAIRATKWTTLDYQKAKILPRTLDPEGHWVLNTKIVCPYCRVAGNVYSAKVQANKGISGEKAIAAWVTGGISLATIGISNIEVVNGFLCKNCNTDWKDSA